MFPFGLYLLSTLGDSQFVQVKCAPCTRRSSTMRSAANCSSFAEHHKHMLEGE